MKERQGGVAAVKERQVGVPVVVLLVFLGTLVLLWFLRHSIRETLVIPILYLLWLGRLVFNSIHQAVFWGLLLLAAAILLLRGLRRRSQPGPAGARRTMRQHRSRRVAHWAVLVERTPLRSSHDIYALNEFRRLISAVWAYRAHLSPQEIERDIRSGVLDPPPELQLYFEDSAGPGEPGRGTIGRALDPLRSWFRGRRSQPPSSANAHLWSLIESLENDLEANRDR
jgi:hypothetical protein